MAKIGKQTRSDLLKRDTRYHEVLKMDDNLHFEETNAFLMFILVFIRYDFGSRYLVKIVRRVLFTMLCFTAAYWFLFALLGKPQWLIGNYEASYWTFGIMAISFVIMAIVRRSKIKLNKIRRFEVYSWSSGHSYFLPLGKMWMNFLNRIAIRFQKIWNFFLSSKNKFEPREDVFWNDVGQTRKYIEPFVGLTLTVLFYFLKQPLPCLWFAFVTYSLRSDASRFIEEYHRTYNNMQDNELIAEAKARVIRRRQTDGDTWSSRVRKAVEFNNTAEIEEELRQELALWEEEKKQMEQKDSIKNVPPLIKKKGEFSLDDAFDSIQEDAEK